MVNGAQTYSGFEVVATVCVSKYTTHSCAVTVGQKLDSIGRSEIEKALDLPGISVRSDLSKPIHVLDHKGDIIPLVDLVPDEIILGVAAVFIIGMFLTYKYGYSKGSGGSNSSFGHEVA